MSTQTSWLTAMRDYDPPSLYRQLKCPECGEVYCGIPGIQHCGTETLMRKFYVTYGNNLLGKYSVVEAYSYAEARTKVFNKIGKFWAFMYDEEEFAGQVEKYDLKEIPLTPMEVCMTLPSIIEPKFPGAHDAAMRLLGGATLTRKDLGGHEGMLEVLQYITHYKGVAQNVERQLRDATKKTARRMDNEVPKSHPVKVLRTARQKKAAKDLCTCGTCGRSWDDAISTSMTPVPSGRCPFEYFHKEK